MTDGWLGLDYLTPAQLGAAATGNGSDILGIAAFATGSAPDASEPLPAGAAEIPVARVPLPPLSGEPARYEVWRASGPLRSRRLGAVHCRDNGRFLFGCLAYDEAAEAGADGADGAVSSLGRATERAYVAELLEVGLEHAERGERRLPLTRDRRIPRLSTKVCTDRAFGRRPASSHRCGVSPRTFAKSSVRR